MFGTKGALCGTRAVAVLVSVFAAVGCKTTETVLDSIDVEVPKEDTSIFDTQLKVLNERAEAYPKRADLRYKIAAIHFQRANYRESAKFLEKAIYLDPNHVRYYFDLGRVHLQMGETEEAEVAFRKAVEMGGADRWSGLYSAHGYTLCHLRRWDEARERFEKCIEIAPDDPTPYYFLGSIADIHGRERDAVRHMQLYLEKGGRSFRRRAIEILGFHGVKVEEMAVLDGPEGVQESPVIPGPAPAGL